MTNSVHKQIRKQIWEQAQRQVNRQIWKQAYRQVYGPSVFGSSGLGQVNNQVYWQIRQLVMRTSA